MPSRRAVLWGGLCWPVGFWLESRCAAPALASSSVPAMPACPFENKKVLIVVYSATGTTARAAERLARLLGADVARLETVEPYKPSDAREDRKRGFLPAVRALFKRPADYDRVIVAFPICGYTTALPIRKWLETEDFGGKPVSLLTTDVGRWGDVYADFERRARNARFDGFPISLRRTGDMPDGVMDRLLRKRMDRAWSRSVAAIPVPLPGAAYPGDKEVQGDPVALEWTDRTFARTLPRVTTIDPALTREEAAGRGRAPPERRETAGSAPRRRRLRSTRRSKNSSPCRNFRAFRITFCRSNSTSATAGRCGTFRGFCRTTRW